MGDGVIQGYFTPVCSWLSYILLSSSLCVADIWSYQVSSPLFGSIVYVNKTCPPPHPHNKHPPTFLRSYSLRLHLSISQPVLLYTQNRSLTQLFSSPFPVCPWINDPAGYPGAYFLPVHVLADSSLYPSGNHTEKVLKSLLSTFPWVVSPAWENLFFLSFFFPFFWTFSVSWQQR